MSKGVILKTVDDIVCITLIALFIISGGRPLSPVIFSILERVYDIDLPTYSIHELLDIVDAGNMQLALEEQLSYSKISIDTYSRLLDLLKSKNIEYTQIKGYEEMTVKLKIEGNTNVVRLTTLLGSISTEGTIRIQVNYLNDGEAVLSVIK